MLPAMRDVWIWNVTARDTPIIQLFVQSLGRKLHVYGGKRCTACSRKAKECTSKWISEQLRALIRVMTARVRCQKKERMHYEWMRCVEEKVIRALKGKVTARKCMFGSKIVHLMMQ